MKLQKSIFTELVDRIRHIAEQGFADMIELEFVKRQAKIEMAHAIGKEIRAVADNNITELLQALTVKVKISERSLWWAVKLYDTYPDLAKLPEGKNITYNKLITQHLRGPQEPCNHLEKEKWQITRCAECREELKKEKL